MRSDGAIKSAKHFYWRTRRTLALLPHQVKDIAADISVVCKVYSSFITTRHRKGRHEQHPDTNLRALIVSYYTPPYRSVYGTQRLAKFIKYLTELGWRISVVSTSPSRDGEADPAGERLPPSVMVRRVVDRKLKRLGGRHMVAPDDFIGWVEPAVDAMMEATAEVSPDVIIATVPPYSNLIAASIVARRIAVPLVADFRDPWSKIDIGWVLSGHVPRFLTRLLERAVIRHCQAIVMVDSKRHWEDFFITTSPEVGRKIHSIPNGYDESDFCHLKDEELTSHRNDKFTISYVGLIYNEEAAALLKEPIKAWARQHPADMKNVRFVYAGPSTKLISNIGDTGLEFFDHGYLPHREAISVRAQSNVQLFSQPASFKPHVTSGKIYEMLRVNVPILARTATDSDPAALIRETNAGVVIPQDDNQAAAAMLKQWFSEWSAGNLRGHTTMDVVQRYSRAELASVFSQVLAQTIHTDRDRR
jgi:glycosyltransferase involved in cell wall biosynthesis